ncbi:endonuclease domain-containing protein [Streptomyces longispororuber]|uniref:endonuclease domain-containing protein n=1 Tax=Streptomyces longispororuber TaxID=68230 RepID=UPI0027E5AAC0|nr:endonuclease domain-containing protein [Streptomyces longispororuber]
MWPAPSGAQLPAPRGPAGATVLPRRPEAPAGVPTVPVDRGHGTGKVRGVLSRTRNTAVGTSGDEPATLRRAMNYVEGNPWKPTLVAPGVCRLPS